ncbi:MAG: hypothetical protein H6594_02270 [Flavobacteriales bacterium]|nr:hypothetical protein [Flavobacteriales bacterium]
MTRFRTRMTRGDGGKGRNRRQRAHGATIPLHLHGNDHPAELEVRGEIVYAMLVRTAERSPR